jgi:FdhD protein
VSGGGAAEAVRGVPIERFRGGERGTADDRVAREEPLEIQVGATPVAVVMRTPGDDRELALGFLLTEALVGAAEDVAALRYESVASRPEAAGNVIRAMLRPGIALDLESLRRNLYTGSSCGTCGKASLERVLATAPPLEDPARFDPGVLLGLPERLQRDQCGFAETGGLHAAALFDGGGRLLVVREDVGRHNAVDKAIGWAAGRGLLPLAGHGLLVSGRISFEIVQKALAARLPLVAAVSAPTSLAVELAAAGGVTLVGFLRGAGFNVYGERSRIAGARLREMR